MPKISVIIATYNNDKYISEAINSILAQTYSDFELIIIDDGSTDNTGKIIKSYTDNRIIYVNNETNRGVSYSRNKGLYLSKGDYIAVMDGDDISLPQRLEKQLNYMEHHTDIAICGCNFKQFGKCNGVVISPADSDDLKARILFYSPLAHSSWFIRKSDLIKHRIKYNEAFRTSLDYELMYRLLDKCDIACIQEVLVLYRVHSNSITGCTIGLDKNTVKVQRKLLKKLHIHDSRKNIEILNMYQNINSINIYLKFLLLVRKIIRQNKRYNVFNQSSLENELRSLVCKKEKLNNGN